MHPYATDSSERRFVPVFLASLSILAALLLDRGLRTMQFTFPWWLDAPAVMGFYGLFYAIFDRFLWRMRIVRKIGLVKLPDLNGTWKGYVVSSFNQHGTKYNANIEIHQSWTRIGIILKTETSNSQSQIATILTENPNSTVLSYEYRNEPKPNAITTMHAHRGTARLTLKRESQVFEGEYYTGRDRQHFGTLFFERAQNLTRKASGPHRTARTR